MRSDLGFLHQFYTGLLRLYPKTFRKEYGDELQIVFDLSIDDAGNSGGSEMTKVILRELLSLPMAAFFEHLRERRKAKMAGKFASRFDFEPGSGREAFAALTPFLFGMAMVFFGYIGRYLTFPLWAQVAFVILFWSAILGLFLLGSAKGLPRWFLPYLGLPLPFFSLLLFNSLMEKLQGVWWYGIPWIVSSFIQEGLFWMGLVILLILLLIVTRIVPKTRPFHQRLRDDWTLLSFVVYGTLPLVLMITNDGYKNEEPFMFLSLMSLAAGGWFYLRNDDPWKRFWSLFVGSALSMLIAAVGKAVLHDSSWPTGHGIAWKTEFMYTMITWVWLAVIMILPVVLNLLPRPKSLLHEPVTG